MYWRPNPMGMGPMSMLMPEQMQMPQQMPPAGLLNPMMLAQNIQIPPNLEPQWRQYRTETGEKGEEPMRADEWLKMMQQQGAQGG